MFRFIFALCLGIFIGWHLAAQYGPNMNVARVAIDAAAKVNSLKEQFAK